jgi:drug/metabolite transporter (DMT)-like permease
LAGSSVPAAKFISGSLSPLCSSFLALLLALAVLALACARRAGELRRLDGRGMLSIALQSLSGMVAFRLLMLGGLRLTSALHAGIISAAGPLAMAAASAVFLKEGLGGRTVAGIAVSVAGILAMRLLGAGEARGMGGETRGLGLLGDAMVGAAVLCEAAMSIVRKRWPPPVSAPLNAALVTACSAAAFLPLALAECLAGGLPALGPAQAAAVLYYGCGATALAYLLWSSGSAKAPGTLVAQAMAAMPLSALALSALVLGERPGAGEIAGAALCLGGMVIGMGGGRRPALPR